MKIGVGFSETSASRMTRCSRCGGLMIIEQGFDSLEETEQLDGQIRRCVHCGDLVDPIILKNRQLQVAHESGIPKR